MSYSVDANVLLYASDRPSPRHAAALRFLEGRASDPDLLCVAWITLLGYVRIATHPRVFVEPLSPAEAVGNIEALLRLPRVRVLSEVDGFLQLYREMTAEVTVRGYVVPDAHLAALLQQHGVHMRYATDTDFRKFGVLDIRHPFS